MNQLQKAHQAKQNNQTFQHDPETRGNDIQMCGLNHNLLLWWNRVL